MIRHVLTKLGSFRSTLAVSLGVPFLIAASAFAQEPAVTDAAAVDPAANANPAAGSAVTERVVVTGSYIPTAETESALPVTVYTAAVIQKQGAQTPAEGIRQLPSFLGETVTENDSNGGDGSAFINLRALGFQNTLTLINGRRAFNFNNINAIPLGALSRTEVLKDGASAIYGSDAVAGVVNFILLNGPGEAPYEGAEIFGLYGNTTDTDARVLQTYVRGGVATDKVAIAAAGEYYDRDNLFARDREIAGTGDNRNLGGANGNSPTYAGRVQFRTMPGLGAASPTQQSTILDLGNNAPTGPESYRAFDPTGPGTDPDRFNFRAFSPAIPAVEKAHYYVTGRYKIFGEGLQIYGDILYAKTKQDNGLAAAPFALAASEVEDSPFNPFEVDQVRQVRYRLVNDLGNRKTFNDQDYYRYVAGLNGDFSIKDNMFVSNWGYDAGFVYERADLLSIDSGDARRTVIADAILGGGEAGGILFNPFIGQNAPVTGTAPTYIDGVPTGLMAAYDNRAVAQIASYIGRSFALSRDYLFDVKVFGNLFPGLYNGGIGAIAGYEHRNNAFNSIPDPVQVAGDQLGFNAAPLRKFLTEVDSYFGEIRLPLVISTMNVPFVKSFEVAFAYRFEEFKVKNQFPDTTDLLADSSRFDNEGTPRLSVRYQPYEDLTLRFSYGQSFLSPSGPQLFDPVSENFPVLVDAFRSGTFQPPEAVFQGGNAALTPERTDSYTAGLVYTPKWLPGFTTTVDFYQAFTRGVILSASEFAQLMLTQNANFLLANPGAPFASAPNADPDGPGAGIFQVLDFPSGPLLGVTRDTGGDVVSIDSASFNAGKRLVNGMDVTASYQIPTQNWGTFTISTAYNYFFTWKAEPIDGAGSTNFLGNYVETTLPLAPGALPYHKGFLRGEWAWRGFDFISTVNYISSFNDDSAFLLDANIVGGTDTFPQYDIYRRVSDYITLDMQLSYEFTKPEMQAAVVDPKGFSKDGKNMSKEVAGVESSSIWQRILWGTTVTVGVNNAFDRNPPTVIGSFNDNYDTSLYSIRNRYYYVSLSKKF